MQQQTPMMKIYAFIEEIIKKRGDEIPFDLVKISLEAQNSIEDEKQMVKDAFYYARNHAADFDYYYNEKYNAELPPTT